MVLRFGVEQVALLPAAVTYLESVCGQLVRSGIRPRRRTELDQPCLRSRRGTGGRVGAGLLLALFPLAADIADPFLQFFRAIPALAVLPALFIVFGTGSTGNVAAIAFGAVWPILLNTLDGIRSIDPSIRLVARSYRIRTPLLVTQVLLPGAMPQITVGIRTSLAIGVVIMVGSEMYVSTAGIGHFVIVAQQTFAIADMWSGILLLGIIGYVLNLGYGVIERWLLRWQPRTHDALAVKGN